MAFEIRVGRFVDSAVYEDDQYMIHVARVGAHPLPPLTQAQVRRQPEADALAAEYAAIYHAPVVRGVVVRGHGFRPDEAVR